MTDPALRPRPRLRLAVAGLLVAGTLAACGGASAPSVASVASAAPVESAAPSQAAASAGTVIRVSANTASQAEIAAALEAAGVPNASRWAREVEEYRPYPADDPTLQRLQDNLAKYNPDPATLAGILAALEP